MNRNPVSLGRRTHSVKIVSLRRVWTLRCVLTMFPFVLYTYWVSYVLVWSEVGRLPLHGIPEK